MLNPTLIEEFARGECKLPCTPHRDESKTIKTIRVACQVIGANQEDEDDTSPVIISTQGTLISTSHKNILMHSALKACAIINAILIPEN